VRAPWSPVDTIVRSGGKVERGGKCAIEQLLRISEVARSLRSVQQWPLKLPPCSLRLAVFTLPPATLGKLYKGEVFNESEQEMANVCLPFPKSACLIFPSIDAVREILRQHPRNDRTPRSTTKSPGCARP
jgi:hypothetical protein